MRVPCYIGDLKRDPNSENYPCRIRVCNLKTCDPRNAQPESLLEPSLKPRDQQNIKVPSKSKPDSPLDRSWV